MRKKQVYKKPKALVSTNNKAHFFKNENQKMKKLCLFPDFLYNGSTFSSFIFFFGFTMFDNIRDKYEMIKKMREMQDRLSKQVVSVASSDEWIHCEVNGLMKITSLTIKPDHANNGNAAKLEKEILTVVNRALEKAQMLGATVAKEMGLGGGM